MYSFIIILNNIPISGIYVFYHHHPELYSDLRNTCMMHIVGVFLKPEGQVTSENHFKQFFPVKTAIQFFLSWKDSPCV